MSARFDGIAAILVSIVVALVSPAARIEAAGFVHSANFIVFTPPVPSQEAADVFAKAILDRAEQLRRQISIEWLGNELPPSIGPVMLNVNFANQPNSALTWAKDHPDRKFHSLFIETSPGELPDGLLAHEMTHCILATRYPHPQRLPAWLEEGIASQYDDVQRQEIRQRIVSWFVTTGQWPRLASVLSTQRVHSDDQQAYAVATTVTELLLERGSRQKLLQFGEAASKDGVDRALKQYYDIAGTAELEVLWRGRLSQASVAPATVPR
jgi:hypothetical protein